MTKMTAHDLLEEMQLSLALEEDKSSPNDHLYWELHELRRRIDAGEPLPPLPDDVALLLLSEVTS
jgi:hypothetical protein